MASKRVSGGKVRHPCANRLVIMNGTTKPGTCAAICRGSTVLPYCVRATKKIRRIHHGGRLGRSMRAMDYLLLRNHVSTRVEVTPALCASVGQAQPSCHPAGGRRRISNTSTAFVGCSGQPAMPINQSSSAEYGVNGVR